MAPRAKISIIIPCYQKGAGLKGCLDSILSQSLQEIEIICVNDGSTDNTKEILDAYAAGEVRLQVFHQENQGVSATRNFALKQAQGEFVAFMDADDEYPAAHTLERLYLKAKEHDVDIAGGSIELIMDGTPITQFDGASEGLVFKHEGTIHYDDYQFDYGFTRFIYKRELIIDNQIEFPPLVYFEDPVFFVRAMACAQKFYASPQPSYLYHLAANERQWKQRTICDALRGIELNLTFSKNKNYPLLHLYTLLRFYEGHIFQNMVQLVQAGDLATLRAFLRVVRQIDEPLYRALPESQAFLAQIQNHRIFIRATLYRSVKNMLSFKRPFFANFQTFILCLKSKMGFI